MSKKDKSPLEQFQATGIYVVKKEKFVKKKQTVMITKSKGVIIIKEYDENDRRKK